MLIFTLLATTAPDIIVDDQEASLNGIEDDFHDPAFCRFGALPAQCSQTSEKNIWHIDDPKEQNEWLEAVQDDDGALPRKALDHANKINPEGGFDLYDDITELKPGSFSRHVWRSSAGDQCLYVVKLWKKDAMSTFNRSLLEANHSLSDMKRLSFLTTPKKAFQRLSFLMDQQQHLETNPPIRVLIPCALIVVGHGDNAEFIEISECASGKSLEEIIKTHTGIPEFLINLFFQAGQQLALLHQDKHTIHGDLSPGNMFVNKDTHVFSWIDTQSVCILGDGDHSHQYEEEVRTMVGYLMRGYDEETADREILGGTNAAATISPRAQALKKFEGGLSIPDTLKKQLAEAFIDGYIANLRTNTYPSLRINIQHMRSALTRCASPAGLTDIGSLENSILSQ